MSMKKIGLVFPPAFIAGAIALHLSFKRERFKFYDLSREEVVKACVAEGRHVYNVSTGTGCFQFTTYEAWAGHRVMMNAPIWHIQYGRRQFLWYSYYYERRFVDGVVRHQRRIVSSDFL